jgi:hypothetical protein
MIEPAEFWMPVRGYDGRYFISDRGRVASFVSKRGGKVLNPCKDSHGYHMVTLCSLHGLQTKRRISQLVLEAFAGERPVGMIACHGPKGKEDNSICNLYWGTYSDNLGKDKIRDGTSNRGSRNGMSKLSDGEVVSIKAMCDSGLSCRHVASLFNVSRQIVSDIKFGRRWSWLTKKQQ